MKALNLLSTRGNYITLEVTKKHRTNLVLFVQLALAGYDGSFLTAALSPNRKISTRCIGYLKTNYELYARPRASRETCKDRESSVNSESSV